MSSAFVIDNGATYDDLSNTMTARLSQIWGIAEVVDPDHESDSLWALKDLTSECKQIAGEMRKRFLAAGGDAFHNTQESDE